jgi:hypothetical protein
MLPPPVEAAANPPPDEALPTAPPPEPGLSMNIPPLPLLPLVPPPPPPTDEDTDDDDDDDDGIIMQIKESIETMRNNIIWCTTYKRMREIFIQCEYKNRRIRRREQQLNTQNHM